MIRTYVTLSLIVLACLQSHAVSQDLVATVNRDLNIVLFARNPVEAVGVDIMSANGRLVPGAPDDLMGFQFLLANTANQVTFANLGTKTMLDGAMVTPVGYNPSREFPPLEDLSITWGENVEVLDVPVIPLRVLLGGGADAAAVPEPATQTLLLLAALSIGLFRRRR